MMDIDYQAWERDDDRREFGPAKLHRISCSDRMCGAEDCRTCHPEAEEDSREDPEE